jgi:hypothetical protein
VRDWTRGVALKTTSALRGTNELRRLLDAIVAATDHDEADWLEWTSNLDLTTKDECFPIARTVLGMANRSPERANLMCEGLGYIVVGAEPGRVEGVTSVDPARLDQLIEPYLGGSEGPRWTPTYVVDGDKTVLVVSVEAPRPGDPMFTLRREFDRYLSGAVFVRKQGRTVQADASDMDALQRRLTAIGRTGGASLDVRAVGNLPLSWIVPDATRPAIECWANRRHDDLIEESRAVERSRHEPEEPAEPDFTRLTGLQASIAAMAQQQNSLRRMMEQASLGSFLEEEDTRTLDEYVEQVDKWRDRLVEAALEALPGAYVAHGHGVLALEVENLGSRFLPDVEVDVRFEFEGAAGYDDEPRQLRLPSPPRALGKPRPRADLFPAGLVSPAVPASYLSDIGGIGRRTWVEEGSIVVKFGIGDLRQHATDTSDDVYIFLTERPEDGVLHGTWKATVRDIDGLLTGIIDIPVCEDAVDAVELLTATVEDD